MAAGEGQPRARQANRRPPYRTQRDHDRRPGRVQPRPHGGTRARRGLRGRPLEPAPERHGLKDPQEPTPPSWRLTTGPPAGLPAGKSPREVGAWGGNELGHVDAPHLGDDHDGSRASAPRTPDLPMYGPHFRTPAHRAPACADSRRAGHCSQAWGSASLVGQILWGPRDHGAGSEPYEPGNHTTPPDQRRGARSTPRSLRVLCYRERTRPTSAPIVKPMSNVTEADMRAYLEAFHDAYRETALATLPADMRDKLERTCLAHFGARRHRGRKSLC
jgi:hypothetical protein